MKKTPKTSKKKSRKVAKAADGPAPSGLENGGYCTYVCTNGVYLLNSYQVEPGYICPDTLPGTCANGSTKTVAPVPVEEAASLQLVRSSLKNAGEYTYSKTDKALVLVRGNCGKGRVLHTKISIKDLKKVVPKLAEQIVGMSKAKHVTSFNVVLPAVKKS